MPQKRKLISWLMILSIALTACQTIPAPTSTPASTPTPSAAPKISPGSTGDITIPRSVLEDELKAAEKAGAALGAQAMEAELRPKLEAWKEAAKWIAAGGLGLGAVGAAAAFIYGFTLGAK